MKSAFWLAIPLAMAALVGCTKQETNKDAASATAPVAAPAKPVDVAPDVALQKLFTDLSENRPQAVWQALPKRYQDDVKGVISDFGSQVDPEVWDKAFAMLRKALKVAKEKRQFILANPLVSLGLSSTPLAGREDEIEKNWNSVVEFAEILAGSEISTAAGLTKLDPDKFLTTTGSKVVEHGTKLANAVGPEGAENVAKLKGTKVSLVDRKGDEATVKIETPNEPSREMKLVKVDGKWLPEEMVTSWESSVNEIKDKIALMKLPPEKKDEAVKFLSLVDAAADQLLEAKTQADFDSAVQALFVTISTLTGN